MMSSLQAPATCYKVEYSRLAHCTVQLCLLLHRPVLIPLDSPPALLIGSFIALSHSTTYCPLVPQSLTVVFVIVLLVMFFFRLLSIHWTIAQNSVNYVSCYYCPVLLESAGVCCIFGLYWIAIVISCVLSHAM